ncbi:MAG: hypothetical protein ACI4BD_06305 [Paludibacteraceae bacterium]
MKKLFTLCIAFLCGIVSISAKTLYCKMEYSWWTADGAAIAAYAWNSTDNTKNADWPGVLMTHPENDVTVWTTDIDTKFDKIIFVRVSSTGGDWGAKSADQTIPTDEKDLFTITSDTAVWGNPGCTGEWSVYVAPAEPIKNVYTVAGVTAILGSEWSATDTSNDMTEQEDGTYKLEKTDVLLNAGEYQFKIVVNHSWSTYLMDNQTLTVETAGYHTLTFTYDASTNVANATATLTKEEEVDPVIQIKGQFDNDDATNWVIKDLTLAADKKTASTTLTLTARTIEMGILLDGNWNSNGKEIKPSSNSITLTDEGTGNIKLYASEEGEYTFTYTIESKTLEVTFPAGATDPLPVLNLFGSWDEWKAGTPFTPAADGLTATAKLTLSVGNYTFKITKDGTWMTNDLSGTMERDNSTNWPFVDGAGKNATGLKADAQGEYTFTWTYEGDKLSVTFPAATATDLIGADTGSAAVKLIRNGQVLIVRDGVTYNIVGQAIR